MEDFISYSIKEKFSTLFFITIMSVLAVFSLPERIMPISIPFLMLCLCLFYIKEKRSIFNKYKIVNNSLIIKKITKERILNFENLEKVVFDGNVFLLKFSNETIKIFYNGNTSKLIDYFLKNNLETLYNLKYQEIDDAKRLINVNDFYTMKYRKLKIFLIFIISILCVIDLIVEKTDDFRIFFIAGITMFCAVASFVAIIFSFTKKKNFKIEQECIDKNGFHLQNEYISFSEISELSKILKKWNIVKLKIITKDNREYEIPAISFNGDILYEMYLRKKINT